jgi:very-short-patch-repair endonuclease
MVGSTMSQPPMQVRDRRLTEEGYKVLRFWNNDVLGNLDGVLITIHAELVGLGGEPSS